MDLFLRNVFSPNFLYMAVRVTTPILFGALGALIANKSGSPNIAIEGIMLVACLAGVVGSWLTGSAILGMLFAILFGLLIAFILAYFTLELRTNPVLAGIALNIFADGATVITLFRITGDKGASTGLLSKVLPNLDIPIIKDIPVLGQILSGHHVLTYVAVASIFFVAYMLHRTPLGMHIRAVGENPNAAASVGINVKKIRYISLLFSGFFAALGGVFLSMGYASWFTRGMTAGRGWIAIAAQAMSRGNVVLTTLASLLFGVAQAVANVFSVLTVPSELVGTVPYLATLVILVINGIREWRKRKNA